MFSSSKSSSNRVSGSKTLATVLCRAVFVFATAAVCQAGFAQVEVQSNRKVATVEQVNVNEAEASRIADVLQGVGQSRARAIVEYREQNGPFDSIDELSEVKGIGEATVNLNRDRILLE